MEQFETEEQQVEAIKRFWKENGIAIVAGAVLGLGGLWGWRYYTDSQLAAKEVASTAYQQGIQDIAESQSPEALESFAANTEQRGYQSLSGLIIAQQAVEAGDLEKAADALQNVLVQQGDAPLAQVAALRLASIQIEQGQFDVALSTLDKVTDEAFKAEALILKGDAYSKLERFDNARQSYVAALDVAPENRLIQLKLDNLALLAGA
ncbi:hypothetical protein DRW07_12610 [Alteromonas sediminis]|uniref:Ancillary SecYEG translocon subunit n=1 Tax=Alteromonas sediminis TaxID=2259342 RepID=A0A3N5XZY0_9ALTE|nr:tetratricopeptide repeat protein [Alteromonas sediminis]RPJ65656.1 hypothetical protein DRW07_12610 [Alteromonas sediminis]